MSDNLKLWNAVCETNPDHTKEITLGRKITAIDPYRQIEAATAQFGPVGVGWGWSVSQVTFLPTDEVGVLIDMWHGDSGKTFCHWGQASLYIDNAKQKRDKDCMKKATTDGVTKCLSMLGFNADIFLGKFDDNKYVQELKNKAEWKGPLKKQALKDAMTAISQDMREADSSGLNGLSVDNKAVLDQCKIDLPDWFSAYEVAMDKRISEINQRDEFGG